MIIGLDRLAVRTGLWLIAGVIASGCAHSSSHTEPAQPTEVSAGADSGSSTDPLICRKEDVPGHRMPKRVCRHQSEIDADRAAAQTMMQAQPAPANPELAEPR
jgi:hypothetical protein